MYSAKQSRARKNDKVKAVLLRFFLGTIVAVPFAMVVYVQFFQEPPVIEPVLYELEVLQPIEVGFTWPSDGIGGVGAVGYGVLETSPEGEEAQVPIASITKLFTALAIMKEKPLNSGQDGELIIFGAADEQLYIDTVAEGGSSYPINNGDQLTQYEALQALLVASANNVADSLVLWAFGSEQAYLDYVNAMATEMGLADTVIADASGMSPASVSTVNDLVVVAEAVLADPVLASIVRQSQAVIDPAVGTIFNTNPLLGEPFVVGVKTGTTDEAGANLLFAAEYALTEGITETIIGVTLGIPERTTNTEVSTDILNTSYQNFGFIEVLPEGAVVGAYDVPWTGTSVDIVSNGGLTVAGWTAASYEPTVRVAAGIPGFELNQEVGTVDVMVGPRETSVPATLNGAIPEPSLWWRLINLF